MADGQPEENDQHHDSTNHIGPLLTRRRGPLGNGRVVRARARVLSHKSAHRIVSGARSTASFGRDKLSYGRRAFPTHNTYTIRGSNAEE